MHHLVVGTLVASLTCALALEAHADVTRAGDTITADELQLAPLVGQTAIDTAARLRSADGEERATLEVVDAQGVCGTATRTCADVWSLPGLLLRQCVRDSSCDVGGTANVQALTWLVVTRSHVAFTTELAWKRSGPPITLPELAHATISGLPSGATMRDYSSGAANPALVEVSTWPSAPCAAPTVLAIGSSGGDILATLSSQGTATPTCRGSGTSALHLWSERPVDGSAYTVTLAVRPSTSPASEGEVLTWRDRWTSSPTEGVSAGERWLFGSTDLITPIGAWGLSFAAAPERLSFRATPVTDGTTTRPLRDPLWLARGYLPSGRELFAHHDGGEPLALTPVPFASVRIQSPLGGWVPFSPGNAMCTRGSDPGCLELASPVPFGGVDISLSQGPSAMAVTWRYWNGSTWRPLDVGLPSEASSFTGSGAVRWTPPLDWQRRPTLVGAGPTLPLYVVRAEADPTYTGIEPVAERVASDLLLIERRGEVAAPESHLLTFNRPPVAQLVDASIAAEVGQPTPLDASSSVDPDGDALTFAWTQSSGPSVVGVVPNDSATPSVTLQAPGVYVFAVRANDGELESTEVYVTVRAGTALELEPERNCSAAGDAPLFLVLAVLGFTVVRSRARRRGSR